MAMEQTGPARQLPPEEQQVVGTEFQDPLVPGAGLPLIGELDKRGAPLPSLPRAPMPPTAEVQEAVVQQTIFGVPVLAIDRYSGTDPAWVMLVRWDIPEGYTGDLHELALVSNSDSKTRYRITLASRDQNLPDKQIITPITLVWRRGVLPGGTSVSVEVRSTDGTTIAVEGHITGTVR